MTALSAAVMAWGASTAVIHACPDADACVTVRNAMSASPDVADGVIWFDGLPVAVHVVMGAGNAPDVVTITPPLGFTAYPAQQSIEEGATVRFLINYPEVS